LGSLLLKSTIAQFTDFKTFFTNKRNKIKKYIN